MLPLFKKMLKKKVKIIYLTDYIISGCKKLWPTQRSTVGSCWSFFCPELYSKIVKQICSSIKIISFFWFQIVYCTWFAPFIHRSSSIPSIPLEIVQIWVFVHMVINPVKNFIYITQFRLAAMCKFTHLYIIPNTVPFTLSTRYL